MYHEWHTFSLALPWNTPHSHFRVIFSFLLRHSPTLARAADWWTERLIKYLNGFKDDMEKEAGIVIGLPESLTSGSMFFDLRDITIPVPFAMLRAFRLALDPPDCPYGRVFSNYQVWHKRSRDNLYRLRTLPFEKLTIVLCVWDIAFLWTMECNSGMHRMSKTGLGLLLPSFLENNSAWLSSIILRLTFWPLEGHVERRPNVSMIFWK